MSQSNSQPPIKELEHLYAKLGYFDNYGSSVLCVLLITATLATLIGLASVHANAAAVTADWQTNKCKPEYMMFSGWLAPDRGDKTASEYTRDNLTQCTQNILKSITGYAIQPIVATITALQMIFAEFADAISSIRQVVSNVRTQMAAIAEQIMARVLNVIIPIQHMLIAFKDIMAKSQGILVTAMYTALGTYDILKALLGAITELIIKILLILVVIIVGLWIMPFTWPMAATMTAVFTAIAIPMSILVIFMKEILHVQTSGIPSLRCFAKDTQIATLDRGAVAISEISVGEQLADGGFVTAKLQLTSRDLDMWSVDGVIVSGNHRVSCDGAWILSKNHPNARRVKYSDPHVWCLNTSTKHIEINGLSFLDWDEIDSSETLERAFLHAPPRIRATVENIHLFLNIGWDASTLLDNGCMISAAKVGDKLASGSSEIYGIVEIYGQCGGEKRHNLLTTSGHYTINGVDYGDYNTLVAT